jgi:hypothetical protein
MEIERYTISDFDRISKSQEYTQSYNASVDVENIITCLEKIIAESTEEYYSPKKHPPPQSTPTTRKLTHMRLKVSYPVGVYRKETYGETQPNKFAAIPENTNSKIAFNKKRRRWFRE